MCSAELTSFPMWAVSNLDWTVGETNDLRQGGESLFVLRHKPHPQSALSIMQVVF